MVECRNCGGGDLQDLGPIGEVAPFFFKRVFGMELRRARSIDQRKQKIREALVKLAAPVMPSVSRIFGVSAYVEMQICSHCCFIQTRVPFRDDDIFRLYLDYRSPSYNRERIHFEPTYAAIADAVGQDEVEIRSRTVALNAFLRRALPGNNSFSILDYGGSDGRFMPDLPGAKFVYEISDIDPVAGVTRIRSESELSTYSLVLLAHVTEHVPHPLKLVRKLSVYVEPGGYIYIETPQEIADEDREDLRQGKVFMDIHIHEHINTYSVPAVSSLLESGGFSVVAIERSPVDVGWAKAVHIRALGRKQGTA